jgi:glutamyl-tRNA reductase
MTWLESREVVPVIRALRDKADRLRRHELEKAVKLLERGEDPRKALEVLAAGLTNKFTHLPTHLLNQASADDRDTLIDTVSRIYQIHDSD